MGSWSDLDANYPPGRLTPATAFVVALAQLSEAPVTGDTSWLYDARLGASPDLRERVSRYLHIPPDHFLAEARDLLRPQQRLCIVLNLCDHLLQKDVVRPERHPFVQQTIAAFAISPDELAAHLATLRITRDLSLFPQ